MVGNPPDVPMLVPAIRGVTTRFGKTPKAVTADRGYGEAAVDAALIVLGVKMVAIPRKGKPGAARTAVQRGRRFTRLVKWRTGSEARIACLKRDFGWRRTLFDGHQRAQVWCGWGVLAHNSVKIAVLTDHARQPRGREPRIVPRTDPPTPASTERTAA